MQTLSQSEKETLVNKMSRFIPHASLHGISLEKIDGQSVPRDLPAATSWSAIRTLGPYTGVRSPCYSTIPWAPRVFAVTSQAP